MKALGQGADGSPRAGCLLASGSEDALGLLLASTYGQGDAGGEGERTAREKRTGDWRESAAGWSRVQDFP